MAKVTISKMTKKIMAILDPKQKEAVEYCDGHELVLAGAGSGKTRVLAAKIAYLIEEKKVAPWRILALTFTNKAAKEMKSRVENLLGSDLKGMEVSTFHAYGLRFLRRYPEAMIKLGYPMNFVIFDRNDTRSLIKKILADLDIDPRILDTGGAIELISRLKTESNPVTGEPAASPKWRPLYMSYRERLMEHGALDFDDLMILPLRILATDRFVLEHERSRLDWILVDEYQDVNRPQYLLLRCLVDSGRKIMVVGDPDQSIYGWRGADMSMIMNFGKDFRGAKVIVLDQNYRSTGKILEGANSVIRKNIDRHPKDLWTASPGGEFISIYRSRSDIDEAQWIADNIESFRDEGFKYSEMAVLYRMNALSRGIEQAMIERGIPYRVIRGLAFYERMEVKDVISMLRLAVNPMDGVSLARAANVPTRGIGKKSLEILAERIRLMSGFEADVVWEEIQRTGGGLKGKSGAGAKELAKNMLQLLSLSSDAHGAVREILYSQGYEEHLKSNNSADWEEKVENVLEILSLVPDDGDIMQVLTEIPLFTDQDTADYLTDSVNLLTLHAAKGLEFPVVFITGMEEGIFPSAQSVAGESDLSEERRLCYVGMTRAKERLLMSGSSSRLLFGGLQRNRTSRFIGEIPKSSSKTRDDTLGGDYFADSRSDRRRWRW